MLCLLLAGACTAAQESEETDQSNFRQSQKQASESELVEITIRLPDGRVIKRQEPRIASKVDTDIPILEGERPPVVNSEAAKRARNKQVQQTGRDVTGGSNASSTNTTGGSGSGGGGGGGGSTGRSSGGGGGSNGNPPPGGGHSGGTTNDNYVPPVQPDLDFTVRMYAWDNTGPAFEHIQEAIVADPRSKTPQRLAQLIAQQVSQQNPDKVVIRFWQEFDPALRYPFDHANPRELIDLGGYSAGLIEYWTEVAEELKLRGVEPDYLIFDQEHGVSFWHVQANQRRSFFGALLDNTRPLSANLPISMRGVTVDQFLDYRSDAAQDAFNDYAQFSQDFRANFLRRIFSEPFNRVYGRSIPISNYWDVISSDPIYRYTGRLMEEATVGGISAPVAYIDDRGDSGSRYSRIQKDQRWNRLIDILSRVRSTAQPGLTTPWIAPPGYGRNGPDTWARADQLEEEKWLWSVMMEHMLAMGIDTFILWNPSPQFNPNAVTLDAWMDDWLAQNPRVQTPQLRNLDPIPLDANRIETNGVVTTYDEYVQMMGIDTQD